VKQEAGAFDKCRPSLSLGKPICQRAGLCALEADMSNNARTHHEARAQTIVPSSPFRAERVSLDALREQVRASQAKDVERPSNPDEKLHVDKDGRIMQGPVESGRDLAEIPQGTFAAVRTGISPRHRTDQRTINQIFPTGTRPLTVDGAHGWVFSFHDEYGQAFTCFVFFDGSLYQVALLAPTFDHEHGSEHDKHLFRDGYLCLARRGGVASLADAYARTVLWANGYTVFRLTGHFPFSINNG